jgi:uncharacterized membrane protein YphA (DoxX/SURF4 family)
MMFFGMQYLRYHALLGGLPPVPPWTPGGAMVAYATGVILLVAGACILLGKKARSGAALIGGLFLYCVLFLFWPKLHAVLYDGVDRTRFLEPLALGGAALALISLLPVAGGDPPTIRNPPGWLIRTGRWLFALPMIVFGWQHFEYARFIATLIPAWIPAHTFWVYFTAIAFIAAALAILAERPGRIAATWLGIMFLLWTVLLHAPRIAELRGRDEWNSAFVALAMCGASLIIARTLPGKELT